MRRILPSERSIRSGSWTRMVVLTPIVFLISLPSSRPAFSAVAGLHGRADDDGVDAAFDVHCHLVHPAGARQVQLEVR